MQIPSSFVAVNLYALQLHYNSFATRRASPNIICQAAAILCTWLRHAQKGTRPGKHSRGLRRRRRSGPAHTARPKWCCSLGLTLKQECFQIVKREKRKKGERREGGTKEKRKNESEAGLCLTLRNSSGSNLHIYDHSPE